MQTPPGPLGLYDPRFEHDSCGVSFVANIKGVRSHELVHTGLVALTNLEHRGATGAEPDTGDGAGILTQVPDRFLREVMRDEVGVELPPLGAYAVGMAFLPAASVAAEKAQAAIETIVADEGLTLVAWRDVPVDPSTLGCHRPRRDAELQAPRDQRPRRRHRRRPRPQGLPRPQAHRARARHRVRHLLPVAVLAHARLQGHAHDAAAVGVLPRPHRRALRERIAPRPQPLLDEHVPVVAAGPPLPLRRPQRRDQHRAGQPELDAGPRGDARQFGAARHPAGLPDLHARRLRHGPLRRGPRAAPPRRAPAAPRRADDDPGGVGEQRRHGRRTTCVLPLPLHRDGALGRTGQRDVHRRHRHRRRARPQRTASEPLLGHRRRPRRDGLRGRRDRHRPGQGRHQGPPAAGPDVPHRHGPGPHRRRRGDQDHAGRRAPVRRVAGAEPRRAGRPARAGPRGVQPRQRAAPPAAVRLHPRGAQGHHRRRRR